MSPADTTRTDHQPLPHETVDQELYASILRATCRRVIVVEDERRLREMLIASIRIMGLEPEGAPNGESALRLLERTVYATAVVDLTLPGMGGLEFCEAVRQRWPAVQLVILTGFGNLDAAQRAIRLDVVDFLSKPCAMGDLEAALERARQRWLDRCLAVETPVQAPPAAISPDAPPPRPGVSMEEMERQLIFAALARHQGNRDAAAAELGISVRKLYYRLQQYHRKGIGPPQ
jgi:DNA-binding NtrC family response regulator